MCNKVLSTRPHPALKPGPQAAWKTGLKRSDPQTDTYSTWLSAPSLGLLPSSLTSRRPRLPRTQVTAQPALRAHSQRPAAQRSLSLRYHVASHIPRTKQAPSVSSPYRLSPRLPASGLSVTTPDGSSQERESRSPRFPFTAYKSRRF